VEKEIKEELLEYFEKRKALREEVEKKHKIERKKELRKKFIFSLHGLAMAAIIFPPLFLIKTVTYIGHPERGIRIYWGATISFILLIIVPLTYIRLMSNREKWKNIKSSFWKKVKKHPNMAYKFLLHENAWHVDDGIHNESQPYMKLKEWAGPFKLKVPNIGLIKIYGKIGSCEDSQEDFESLFS